MIFLRNFSRIVVGLVFIFSGLVKGVDPLGTAYRIEDYFIAYGTEWALPFTLFLSISLSGLEFLLGIVLVLNARIRFFAWPLFLLMIFFTILTLYDAMYEPVPDCGCFGDAIKLSNWETFYKNIILIIFVSFIFFKRKDYRSPFSAGAQNTLAIVFAALFIAFSGYNYLHLPMLDFREWKVGNDMEPDNRGEAKIYLTFRNTSTGEEQEFLSPDYPWQDSAWMANWEFVDQRIDDSEVIRAHELLIENEEGQDVTDAFISNPDFQLLVIAYDLEAAHVGSFKKIETLYKHADREGISLIVITSSLPSTVKKFRQGLDPNLEFYYADDIALKTMIRANPGLMMLKDGIVLGKWHFNDLPSYEELSEGYFNVNND
jgi:uncharacterized membrane protein YphA (DoxX/SURF4 family)